MLADAIIKDFNVFENRSTGLLLVAKGHLMDEFAFKRAPERFHGCVIVAVSFSAHAGRETIFRE